MSSAPSFSKSPQKGSPKDQAHEDLKTAYREAIQCISYYQHHISQYGTITQGQSGNLLHLNEPKVRDLWKWAADHNLYITQLINRPVIEPEIERCHFCPEAPKMTQQHCRGRNHYDRVIAANYLRDQSIGSVPPMAWKDKSDEEKNAEVAKAMTDYRRLYDGYGVVSPPPLSRSSELSPSPARPDGCLN